MASYRIDRYVRIITLVTRLLKTRPHHHNIYITIKLVFVTAKFVCWWIRIQIKDFIKKCFLEFYDQKFYYWCLYSLLIKFGDEINLIYSHFGNQSLLFYSRYALNVFFNIAMFALDFNSPNHLRFRYVMTFYMVYRLVFKIFII